VPIYLPKPQILLAKLGGEKVSNIEIVKRINGIYREQ
jgi:hypothetical protein